MPWKTLLLMTAGTTLVVILTACGGGTTASSDEPYDVQASIASLQEAGWQATEQTEDTPEPYTGVRLVGDLETTAPDGEPIELEFYESPENAQGELDETKKQEAPFEGTTVGNVMVFDSDNDTGAVSPGNLATLRTLLR